MGKKPNYDKMIQNKMREIEIEKMVLNCGGLDEKLERSVKLLEMITGRKVSKTIARKRIPTFGISPGKAAGCRVTIRDKEQITNLLKRFFSAVSNKINKRKIQVNHFSFGIHEYIEVPGLEYRREIGIVGFDITVVFKRKGKRVILKKIKQGKHSKKQDVTIEEITEYLTKHFKIKIETKENQNDSK